MLHFPRPVDQGAPVDHGAPAAELRHKGAVQGRRRQETRKGGEEGWRLPGAPRQAQDAEMDPTAQDPGRFWWAPAS